MVVVPAGTEDNSRYCRPRDSYIAGIPREAQNQLDRILVTADFVKFARVLPPEEESNRMVPESFRFIEETKPRPPVPELVETVGKAQR